METQPLVVVHPDVMVASNSNRIYTFHPTNLRTQMWLAHHVEREHHANGHVVTGPLKAAHIMLSLVRAGFVIG